MMNYRVCEKMKKGLCFNVHRKLTLTQNKGLGI